MIKTKKTPKFFHELKKLGEYPHLTTYIKTHKQTAFLFIGTWAIAEVDSETAQSYSNRLAKRLKGKLWEWLSNQEIFSKKCFVFDFSLPHSTYEDNGRAYLTLDISIYKKNEHQSIQEDEIEGLLIALVKTMDEYPYFEYEKRR